MGVSQRDEAGIGPETTSTKATKYTQLNSKRTNKKNRTKAHASKSDAQNDDVKEQICLFPLHWFHLLVLVSAMAGSFLLGSFVSNSFFIAFQNQEAQAKVHGSVVSVNVPRERGMKLKTDGSSLPKLSQYWRVTEKDSRRDDVEKSEALVHPGMFLHEEPHRVAIIGGTASIVCEVIKHNTVESIVLFQGEQKVLGLNVDAAETDPSTYECDTSQVNIDIVSESNLLPILGNNVSGSGACGQDGNDLLFDKLSVSSKMGGFDVLILNGSHDSQLGLVEQKTKKKALQADLSRILCSLTKGGIFATTLVKSEGSAGRNEMMQSAEYILEEIDAMPDANSFESIHVYDEAHGVSKTSQSFLVACENENCRKRWYANEAYITAEIARRIGKLRTKTKPASTSLPLLHFDGTTYRNYQRPTKRWETMYCDKAIKPDVCGTRDGFDPETPNIRRSDIDIRSSEVGENVGRGAFTKVDIKGGSYIMMETAVHSLYFPAITYNTIYGLIDQLGDMGLDELNALDNYIDGYGYDVNGLGATSSFIDSGYNTFINHGCNGTYNFGGVGLPATTDDPTKYITEENANFDEMPSFERDVYNIVEDRHLENGYTSYDGATKDVKAGSELLSNYVFYEGKGDLWPSYVRSLQAECRGEAGSVVQLDRRSESNSQNEESCPSK